jgi:hypothetical protein
LGWDRYEGFEGRDAGFLGDERMSSQYLYTGPKCNQSVESSDSGRKSTVIEIDKTDDRDEEGWQRRLKM